MKINVAKVQEFKGHTQAIYAICQNKDDPFFYSAGADKRIIKWQIANGEGEIFAQLPSPVYSIFLDYNTLYAGTNNGELYIFDTLENKIIAQKNIACGGIFSIVKQDEKIVLGGENGSIYFYQNNAIEEVKISPKSIRKIIVDNEQLYLASSDWNIYIYNLKSKNSALLNGHINSVFGLAKINNILISGGRDAELFIWENDMLIKRIKAHLLHVNDVQLNSDKTLFASASMDKTIKIWNTQTFELLKVIDAEKYSAHTSSVNKILWTDKNTLISCSDDRSILQFKLT